MKLWGYIQNYHLNIIPKVPEIPSEHLPIKSKMAAILPKSKNYDFDDKRVIV